MRNLICLVAAICLSACVKTGASVSSHGYDIGDFGNTRGVEYGNGLPMTVYLPDVGSGPFPVVVFNHGRPFGNVGASQYHLSRKHSLVSGFNERGFAVALPVRSGYFSAPGPSGERISCNDPARGEFKRALENGRADILAAIKKLETLSSIDRTRIYIGGQSAGGFLTLGSLDSYPASVRAVFSFNGGRCGKRGKLFRGIEYAADLISDAAKESSLPILIVASQDDTVIPIQSSYRLRDAICAARGGCGDLVSLIEIDDVGHSMSRTAKNSIPMVVDFLNNHKN